MPPGPCVMTARYTGGMNPSPYVLPNHIVSIPQIPTFEKPRI